jgi:hypothetical protein
MSTNENPIMLDEHRSMTAQKATEIRRQLVEVEADQKALRQRRTQLEKFLVAKPAESWHEAADKARYLIGLFGMTSAARDPRRQKLIASVLDDFARLADEPLADPDEPGLASSRDGSQADGGSEA